MQQLQMHLMDGFGRGGGLPSLQVYPSKCTLRKQGDFFLGMDDTPTVRAGIQLQGPTRHTTSTDKTSTNGGIFPRNVHTHRFRFSKHCIGVCICMKGCACLVTGGLVSNPQGPHPTIKTAASRRHESYVRGWAPLKTTHNVTPSKKAQNGDQ